MFPFEPHRIVPDELNQDSHAVIGAAIEVHRRLGSGYLEAVYENALAAELRHLGIPFSRQVEFEVQYRDEIVGLHKLDFLVNEHLVVELKAVSAVGEYHRAQVLSYLKATNLQLGLILNFQVHQLRDGIHRVIL
jgi:GxxExxY protein